MAIIESYCTHKGTQNTKGGCYNIALKALFYQNQHSSQSAHSLQSLCVKSGNQVLEMTIDYQSGFQGPLGVCKTLKGSTE